MMKSCVPPNEKQPKRGRESERNDSSKEVKRRLPHALLRVLQLVRIRMLFERERDSPFVFALVSPQQSLSNIGR